MGESSSNGFIERAIQDVQGQIRTIKLAVESRYKSVIKEDHPILPWIVKYAGITISLCRKGEDGRTAYERRRGERYLRELPDFGECVWHLKPESASVNKLESRWENEIFVGIREESNEILVMTKEGVIKVMTFKRRPEGERWNLEELANGKGLPWEPIPGREGIGIKSRVHIPIEREPLTLDGNIIEASVRQEDENNKR